MNKKSWLQCEGFCIPERFNVAKGVRQDGVLGPHSIMFIDLVSKI